MPHHRPGQLPDSPGKKQELDPFCIIIIVAENIHNVYLGCFSVIPLPLEILV